MTALAEETKKPAGLSEDPAEIALKHVLWACDFSACSVDALRFVIPIARAYGSDITALHVIPSTTPPEALDAGWTNPALLPPHLAHDVSKSLDRCLAPVRDASLAAQVALRGGVPVDELLGLAESLPADLLVVGRHARHLIPPGFLGSVARGILGRARCPVLVVPGGATPPPGGLFGTILWATDFSPHAGLALRYAASLAAKSGARLLLMHVVEGNLLTSERAALKQARLRLNESVRACGRLWCAPETIVSVGNAANEIARVAAERPADLVVMGVQGARALHRLFCGSTTHRVVRELSCPVLAVRRR
jgi:nucleotide-binding universal stress UspA family protein